MPSLALSLGIPSARRASPFDPTRITSFLFGYEADRIVGSDGSAVGTWPDMALTPHDATQSTAGSKPILHKSVLRGHAAVTFDAVDDLLQTSDFSRSNPQTIYALIKFTDLTGNKTVHVANSFNKNRLCQIDGSFSNDIIAFSGAGNPALNSTYKNGCWFGVKYLSNGASSELCFNNSERIIADDGGGIGNGLILGNDTTAASPMNGSICLIWGFAEAITAGSDLDKKIWSAIHQRAFTTKLFTPGDSQTAGTGTTAGIPWPTQFQRLIPARALSILNPAITGKTAANLITDAPSTVDAFIVPGICNIVALCAGTNDLYIGTSVQDTYNFILQYHNERVAAGARTVATTIPPRSGPDTPPTYDADRLIVSQMIRDTVNPPWVGIYDVAADPLIGATGAELNTTYFQDRIHRTFAGDTIFAQGMANTIASAFA